MGSFVQDLADGESGEQRLLAHLASIFPECEWVKASKKSPHMDCLCLFHGERIEIKTDRKAKDTGNLAFEAKLFQHTKAEQVCYLVGDKAFCWDTEELKLLLLVLHANNKTRGLLGGDRWANAMIIAPLEAVTKEATVYELTKEGGE